MSEIPGAAPSRSGGSPRRRPAPVALAVLALAAIAGAAIAVFAWRSLQRSELLDPRDLVGEDTAVVLSLTARSVPGDEAASGFIPILERLKKRDAASGHPRLPGWAGWLISGGAASAVLPGRVLLAWDAPRQGAAPSGDLASRPVIALSLTRLPEGLASLVVGPEAGAWTSVGHTLIFTPDPVSPLEVARRIQRPESGGAAGTDAILASLDGALDPQADGWLLLHNGSDRLERLALASLARRGLGGLHLDGTSVVNGRIVANGFRGAELSFRGIGTDEAVFTGSALFRDAASAASGRDWLQRAVTAAASLSGVEVKLDLGATKADYSVPLSGRAKGLVRIWERMIEGKKPGA